MILLKEISRKIVKNAKILFVHVLSKLHIILEYLLLTTKQHVSHILEEAMCDFPPHTLFIVITERVSYYVNLAGLKLIAIYLVLPPKLWD